MVTRSALVLLLVAGCTTPTLDDLAQVKVHVVHAPAAATHASVTLGSTVRHVPLVNGEGDALFGAPARGAFSVSAEALDANENDLQRRTVSGDFEGTPLALVADFTPCVPAPEICDGKDNDCDGVVDDHLTDMPACALTKGVCASAKPACHGADGWGACAYGADYEAVETRCDGKDNDCDGVVDPMTADDPANCGKCGHQCGSDAPLCDGSSCSDQCSAGTHLCGSSCRSDTSAQSCGNRCDPCPTAEHGTASCDSRGLCALTCDDGYLLRNGNSCLPPLRVVATSPADKAVGVPATATIQLKFSRSMNTSFVEQAVHISPLTSGSFTWNTAKDTMTFTPQAPLASGTAYQVVLDESATAADGEQFSGLVSFQFETGPTPAMFVYGGFPMQGNLSSFFDDAWILVLPHVFNPRWIPVVAPNGPPRVINAGVAWDSKRNRVLVTGGSYGSSMNADTWALAWDANAKALAWTKLTVSGTAPARGEAGTGYSAGLDALLVFAGMSNDANGNSCHSDLWKLDFAANPPAWSALAMSGSAPPGVEDALIAWDDAKEQFILSQGGLALANDNSQGCAKANGSDWMQPGSWRVSLPANGPIVEQLPWSHPIPRMHAQVALHGARWVQYGGDTSADNDQLWTLDTLASSGWENPTLNSSPGPVRSGAMVHIPGGNLFALYGGDNPNTADALHGVWILDDTKLTWSSYTGLNPSPPERTEFGSVLLPDVGQLLPQ